MTIVRMLSGLAIKCHVCGTTGICSSPSDVGSEKECGAGFNACIYQTATAAGQTFATRQCFAATEATCNVNNENGVSTNQCICTTDNCNKDCTCPGDESSGPRLKCRVCAGGGGGDDVGRCNDINDIGISKECPANYDLCVLVNTNRPGQNEVYRGCEKSKDDRPLCEYDQKVKQGFFKRVRIGPNFGSEIRHF